MNNSFYMDEYNNNEELKVALNRWAILVFVLIMLNIFWAGIPMWLVIIENFNVALWLLMASQKIYRYVIVKVICFSLGFLCLIAAFANLGTL